MRQGSEISAKLNIVIKYMNDNPGIKTAKEISDDLDMSKSSINNYLNSLINVNCIRLVLNPLKQRKGQTFKYALTSIGHKKAFIGGDIKLPSEMNLAETAMCKLSMIFINQTVNRSGNFI